MKKYLQKAAAAALSVLLVLGCSVPAFAVKPDNAIEKKETAYLILNPDGSVKEQIVSDWLHSDTGFDSAEDISTLENIQNLKSDTQPVQSGNTLRWTTEEPDIFYQGTTQSTPPVSVEIRYTLDGAAVSPAELEGKSGHLVAEVLLINNTAETVSVNGESRTVCTPFFTVAAAVLPHNGYENVRAEHGTVESDSKTQLACFLTMPGIRDALDGLLPEGFTELEDLMLDRITIEADVTDCTVPSFFFAAASNLADLDIEGLTGDSDELDQLIDAIDQLQDGSGALDDAAATLTESLHAFAAGYAEFDDGVDAALSGTQALAAGSGNLLENAQLLSDKSAELAAGAAALQNGTAQLAGLLNTQLVPGLLEAAEQKSALEAKMNQLAGELNNITLPDTSGLKVQLSAGIGTVFDQAAGGAAAAAAQATAAQVLPGCEQAAEAAIRNVMAQYAQNTAAAVAEQYNAALAEVLAQYDGIDEETRNAILEQMASAAPSIDNGALTEACVSAVKTAMEENVVVDPDAVADAVVSSEQMQAAKAGAMEAVSRQIPDIDTSAFYGLLEEFQALSGDATSMLGAVDTLTSALYDPANPANANTVVGASNALADGAETLGNGTAALSSGTSAFAAGTATLSDGAGNLLSGMQTLSGSSKTVADTIAQFETGGAALKDGTAEFYDGMHTFATTIEEKLDALTDPNSTLRLVLNLLQERAESYTGSGCADSESITVQIVMRTEAVEEKTSDTTEPADTESTDNIGSFWDRIKNLFS